MSNLHNDFESINMLKNKSLLIENDGRYGVMDQELNVIIECLYTSISEIDDFLIIRGEEGDVRFDYSGSEIIPFAIGLFTMQIKIIWRSEC